MTDPKFTLSQLHRNLNILREREAKYGGNTPLELINQIDDHLKAISLTEQILKDEISEAEWKEALSTLLLAVNNGQVVNIMMPKTQPPGRKVIADYLQQMLVRVRAEQSEEMPDKSEMLQRLWQQAFYVRRYGQVGVPAQLLDDVLQRYLDRDRPKGAVRDAVMFLAGAGVGKTPALNHILTVVAEKSMDYYRTGEAGCKYKLIPLLIPLAELRPGQDLLPLVRIAFNRDASKNITLDETQALLEEYECLLLLDDLDKLTLAAHNGGIAIIRQFMDNYSEVRYVISCRLNTFNYQLGPMDAFVLDELSNDQVKDVLGDRYNERMGRSASQIMSNRAMLKIIIEKDVIDEKNWSRGTLLRSMIRYQLDLTQIEQVEGDIDREVVEVMLEKLAYQMQCEHASSYSEQQLMQFISEYLKTWHEPFTWRQVIHFLRNTGIMLRDDYRRWHFCNRSTQAYFTAAAVVQDSSLLNTVLENVSDFWWREPLEILVSLIDEPSKLLFELLDRNLIVTAHCLQFVSPPIDQTIIKAVIDAIIEQMRFERAAGREQLLKLLLETGYLPSKNLLWQMLYREQKSLVIMAIANALTHPQLHQNEGDFVYGEEYQHFEIDPELEKVITTWRDYITAQDKKKKAEIEKNLVSFLKKPQAKVQGLAAIALGFIGADSARKALLQQLNQPQVNELVAWCVVEALTQMKQLEVEEAALKLYKQPEQSISQRTRAIYLLGNVGGGFSDTPDILFEALNDANPEIRGYAARAVGRLGLVNGQGRLEERLERPDRETNGWTLRRFIEALGKVGTLESIRVLERYLHHEQLRTRRRTREAISEIRRRFEFT